MPLKEICMKPEEIERNLWVIYRSLPNGMNEQEYNIILTLVQEIEYFLTHEMEYKPAVFEIRNDGIPFEF